MPLYEHTVIARPDLSAQQAQALADAFGEVIGGQGGKVAKVEYWGLRNLSYRVKKNRKGHYLHLNVEAPPAAITELERTQRIHEDVLRYLTVKVEAFEEGPSQVMVAKSSRDERGGGRRDFGDGRGRDRDRDRDRGDRGDRDRGGDRGDRDRGEPRS
jgi:small subunit ribosomal protein S6